MEYYHHDHEFLQEMQDSNVAFGFYDLDYQNALLATPTTVLESSTLSITSSSFEEFSLPFIFDPQTLNGSSFGQRDSIIPSVDHHLLSAHHSDHDIIKLESSPLYDQDYYSMFSMFDDVQNGHFASNLEMSNPQGFTGEPEPARLTCFNMGKNGKNGKVEGLPSKNLMAERRRRKRLNDRLSMLRSIVPKISKMDRTSILADTIDYMKELIEKIKQMQQEMDMQQEMGMDISSTARPEEVFIRNSPKFDVERRNEDTRVSVCCGGNSELLMSTVSTLEALDLEIQQCVISCFNDFTMHASCSEDMEQRLNLNTDDIKQALFRNAGYGGKCL